MTVQFRSGAQVVNGTAGTSVTIGKPAGTVDGDFLLAVIAETGTGSITAPAGWTLIGSQAAATNVTCAVYRKFASGEGASWTWTLGASVRNWGWVGAYTGVHTGTPITEADPDDVTTTETVFLADLATLAHGGRGVGIVAAVQAATGTATTWTSSSTERADMSTNAGAGTDIAGCVGDSVNLTGDIALFGPSFTASQSQTQAVTWAVTLNPAFTAFDGGLVDRIVEIAFGADPHADPDTWVWTDVSQRLLATPIDITIGRQNEAGSAAPASVRLTLLNLDGRYTPDFPTGVHYPYIRRGAPLRVSVPYGFTDTTELVTVFIEKWSPRWDLSEKRKVVDITASGRTRRWQRGDDALRSALYRSLSAASLAAYWSCEDESGAFNAASALGLSPMATSGVTFGSDTSLTGSGGLPQLSATARLTGLVSYPASSTGWLVMCVLKIPTPPAAATSILEWHTAGGTAIRWELVITPAATDLVQIKAYNAAGAELISDSGVSLFADADYDQWYLLHIEAQQNGGNVDWSYSFEHTTGGGGKTGSTAMTLGDAHTVTVRGSAGLDQARYGHFGISGDLSVFGADEAIVTSITALDGQTGERPRERFIRLCQEEGIPFKIVETDDADLLLADDITMGPQPQSTLQSALTECEQVDGGLIYDGGRGGGLTFVMRNSRYNQTPSLVIDHDEGELAEGWAPELDDQRLQNDVTVSRRGGSSARYEAEESVATEGRYRADPVLNLGSDARLYEMAGWRANVGAAQGMRYPAININLRRNPHLLQAWLATRPGSRIQVVNPMDAHAPDAVDQILEGYGVSLGRAEWTVGLVTTPAAPYTIGILDDSTLGRLDADESTLHTAITSTATTWQVRPGVARWTTDSADFTPNLDVTIGGEVARVSAIADAASFVAAGTAAHADNTSVAPGIPAGVQAGDLLIMHAAIRNSGTGSPNSVTGWTSLLFGNTRLYAKVAGSSESAPTVTFGSGAAGDTTSAQICAFRGIAYDSALTFTQNLVASNTGQLNGSGQDIAYQGLPIVEDSCLVIMVAWKQDDWTSVTPPAGWTEIGEPSSTTGNDQGLWWGYQIQTWQTPIRKGTIAVIGGASAISRSRVIALKALQTFTIAARSVNGVVKAHNAGDSEIRVKDALNLAL